MAEAHREVLLKVTPEGMTPITRSELQDGDRIVRIWLSNLDKGTPEEVHIQQIACAERGRNPEAVFSYAQDVRHACLTAVWSYYPRGTELDRGTFRLRVPSNNHQPRAVSLEHLRDPDPNGRIRVQLLDMAKEYCRAFKREPTVLRLSVTDECRLRSHMVTQGDSVFFGTIEKPARPESIFGWTILYEQPETTFYDHSPAGTASA